MFNVIGTTYGDGDGSTTFNTPDLSGRVPVGIWGKHGFGDTGGEETHKLTIPELPDFGINVPTTVNGSMTGCSYNGISSSGYQWFEKNTKRTNTIHRPWKSNSSGDYSSSEMSQPHNNMQPYLVMNYIIYAGV